RLVVVIQSLGDVSDSEKAKVFNLGLGMILVVPPDDPFRAIDVLRSHGHAARRIGQIEAGDGRVRLAGRSAPSAT
ncbi:MAG: phosphoribosylformylglycinamidine cyclo-ligase, partial [Acidimicrobiaceae bacterium]